MANTGLGRNRAAMPETAYVDVEDAPTSSDTYSDADVNEHDAAAYYDQDSDQGPGYAQFFDEDDLEEDASDDSDTASSDGESALRQQIESVPYANLVRAQRAMRKHAPKRESTDPDTLRKRREQAKQLLREQTLQSKGKLPRTTARSEAHGHIEKREHKSAPTATSSRRPVSRTRTVVEPMQRSKQRDPRFDNLSAGPVNMDLMQKSYKFLPGVYEEELAALHTTHKRLKRMEAHHAGPRATSEQALRIREERQNVELALRRAESQRNERKRRGQERAVKSTIKKENQRRVDAGQQPYFPKRKEQHAALLQKKYEHLAGPQGSGAAVKKAMERKQRKDAQKDRKSLDAALGGGSRTDMRSDMRPRKRGRRG